MTTQYVHWFRNSAPYINAHRGKTFVIQFSGEAVYHEQFSNLIHDLALLESLGVNLVIVHGIRPQIEAELAELGLSSDFHDHLRVTDEVTLKYVKRAAGEVRLDIEALLSMGLANSPMAGARIRVASGNFVTAKPLGVRDGIDYGHTGEIRRIDNDSIRSHLNRGEVVIISPIGFSPTGEMFNLAAEEVATAIAIELQASKLILLVEPNEVIKHRQKIVRQLTLDEAHRFVRETQETEDPPYQHLSNALRACSDGVKRAHLVDRSIDGALIAELFTRDGVGTMISADRYEDTRHATIDDVGGILELIEPLEQDGTLVRRSREKLEHEIDQFLVMERDGTIIASAALYPLDDDGSFELACVAVHPDYRNLGRGESLMEDLEHHARSLGATRLFILTTRTPHWFQEMGFVPVTVEQLPTERKLFYNYQRNSRVLTKNLADAHKKS